jgi:ADP-ribosylglycohydrolase
MITETRKSNYEKQTDTVSVCRMEVVMYGAILGDMVGAPYEFDRGKKTRDFEFWNRDAQFTDDSVMSIAIADALMRAGREGTEHEIKD